jgi:hypothetical protein
MTKADYRVRLHGRNFWLADGDEIKRVAFHVTLFVQARDPESASAAAMQALGADADLVSALRNRPNDPPLVFTLEAVPIPPELAPPPKRGAFNFSPDEGTDPEQESV